MLLAIDAGNTNIVFAIFQDKQLIHCFRVSTDENKTSDEYFIIINTIIRQLGIELTEFKGVIISSVVPSVISALTEISQKYFKLKAIILGITHEVPVEVAVDRKNEVGDDRLLNVLAAKEYYGGNVIIIDFGTATTFDIVDKNGAYGGGVIAPGIKLSVKALRMATARLPSVNIEKPNKVIGTTTIEAIESGIFWGYVGLIEGIINRMKQEINLPMKVIATGGLAPIFKNATNVIDEIKTELTINALQICYKKLRY